VKLFYKKPNKVMNNEQNEMKDTQNQESKKTEDINSMDEMALGMNNDDNMAGTNLLEDEDKKEDKVQQLESQLNDTNDKYLRLAAEFDNYRKRTTKEKLDLLQRAGEDVIKSLLDVLDDIHRSVEALETSEDKEKSLEGVKLVFQKFQQTLAAKGLKEMDTKGQNFDAELHEAITQVPAAQPDQSGKIIDEIQKGYFLNEKLIRHAKVVVAE